MKFAEEDLLKPLLTWIYRHENIEVYTEVDTNIGRPDVVTKQGNIISIFEMKKSLSLKVLDQAIRGSRMANHTWIVVPMVKKKMFGHTYYSRRESEALDLILRSRGIGLIEIDLELFYRDYDNVDSEWDNCWFEVRSRTNHIYIPKIEYLRVSKYPTLNKKISDMWDSILVKEFLVDNQKTAGIKGKYLSIGKVITKRVVEIAEQIKKNSYHISNKTDYQIEGYFHPSDDVMVNTVREYYSNPTSKVYNLCSNHKEIFDNKKYGRKLCFRLKDIDIHSKEYWFNQVG